MKKYLAAIAVMIVCQTTFAQSTDAIFAEFKKESCAESGCISPLLMAFGRMFMDSDAPKAAKNICSMKVLDLEECPDNVKERFIRRLNDLSREGYETLIQTQQDGEKVRIMTKKKNNVIRELLIVCTGQGDCTLIQMNGKIKKENIAELVNEQTSKRKNGCD